MKPLSLTAEMGLNRSNIEAWRCYVVTKYIAKFAPQDVVQAVLDAIPDKHREAIRAAGKIKPI